MLGTSNLATILEIREADLIAISRLFPAFPATAARTDSFVNTTTPLVTRRSCKAGIDCCFDHNIAENLLAGKCEAMLLNFSHGGSPPEPLFWDTATGF